MFGSLPLEHWYVGGLALSALALVTTSYIVYTRSDLHHRQVFVGYAGAALAWVFVAIGQFLAQSPAAKYTLLLVGTLCSLCTVTSIGYFATVYTHRSTSIRKPRNMAFLLWIAVSAGSTVTDPVFGLQYTSVTYVQEPVAYLAVEPGPVYLLNVAVTVGVLVVSVSYLARLFATSPHRPTGSILLLGGATAISLLPNAVSNLTNVPVLPGYDYTIYGVAPFTVILAYVVFFSGERDLAPMARKEVVDQIDDVLLGLDDAGNVVDYNAAAKDLLSTDDPVGEQLSTLSPDLATELTLPTDPNEDILTTYTTVTDGARTHYSVSVSPITERGTVAGYSAILRDVTESESAKRELERQNEQLESFATTVAHDLRNPLQIADGASTLLATKLNGDSKAAVDHLERVSSAVSRMDSVLDELQTLAKHAQSVTETESLAFGERVWDSWDREATDEQSLTIPTDGRIEAERTRLDSILDSLCRHSVEQDGLHVVVTLTENGFVYTVENIEMPVSDTEDLFRTDTTPSTATTSLGLKIVRAQVEAQGWRVTVEPTTDGVAYVITGAETTVSDRSAGGDV